MDRILLIDSSEQSSEFIVRRLTRNGHDVMHIQDSVGISLKAKITAFDLIIIDSDIKNESGFDVCRKLKQLEETRYTPVLIIGDNESNNSLMRALESGADDYMSRSFDESNLLSKVRALLRIKHLSDQLIQQYTELEEKNNVLEIQLDMAKQVQRSLIRDIDLRKNDVHIVSRYMPALEIGGDFYDVIVLDEENIAIVIGDVSGHGISAALLTAMLNMMIRNLAQRYYNPAQFLYHMNNEFVNIFGSAGGQMYACMFYAIINTAKKRIYFSNAGQALPIFVNSEGEIAYELEASGMPIGMMKDTVYEHKITLYDENDLILFYTDGLADNLYKDNADEFYTRIKNLLLDMHLHSGPANIIDALTNMFFNKNASQSMKFEMDDVSMIVCRME